MTDWKYNMLKHFYRTILLLGLLLVSPLSLADPAYKVQEVTDLTALAQQARDAQTPILIMFSQRGCTYCTVLEEDYLRPMLRSGDYQDKVIIRKVRIDSFETLRGFNGEAIDADDLAHHYRAYVTPTMVFLDHNGNELTRRLMGIGTEGFFAAEIDQAIATSLNRLRSVALNH
ncbi:MAG: thioredoxin family protein [Thioalkalispiraceae bacterium]